MTNRTTSSIALAWSGSADYFTITVPKIDRTFSTGANSYRVNGLASNVTYTFEVRAHGPGGTSPPATITATTLATYRARVTYEVTGPDRKSVDLAHLRPSQQAWVSVTAENIGTAVWTNSGSSPVRLGTFAPGRQSPFFSPGWSSAARPSNMQEAVVPPGATGTFRFLITAPNEHRKFTERFNLVADGNGAADTWFETAPFALPTMTVIPIVGIASTPEGDGHWVVAADGGVFTYGNASFHGSAADLPLAAPIVGMAASPSGRGYWLVAADGGVFGYGDAKFHGSMGGKPLHEPVVGMAATPSGKGYWLAAADGGVFSFGDAKFHGSMGGKPLNAPVVGIAAGPDGKGYWLAAADGGVFTFGPIPFHGSMGGKPLNASVVGIAPVPSYGGYRLVGADGGIFTFGSARFFGSLGGTPLDAPIAGITSVPNGYLLAADDGAVYKFHEDNRPFRTATSVKSSTVAGCGHLALTAYGPLARCHGVVGASAQSRFASGLTCAYDVDGTQPMANQSSPFTYVGTSKSNDGEGTFEFFGGPQVTTGFGATSYGEQRRLSGFGPLIRWGAFNFVTNEFYPSSEWMADQGPMTCQSIAD